MCVYVTVNAHLHAYTDTRTQTVIAVTVPLNKNFPRSRRLWLHTEVCTLFAAYRCNIFVSSYSHFVLVLTLTFAYARQVLELCLTLRMLNSASCSHIVIVEENSEITILLYKVLRKIIVKYEVVLAFNTSF